MICPKCGFEQPESPECMRCGVIVNRYKGAAVGAPPPPPSPASVAGSVFGGPAPALAGAGTVYEGPPPAALGGGTVYQGPPPGSFTPVFSVETQKLRIGETLSESFAVYFKNIIPFTILTAVAFSPIFLFAGFLTRQVVKNPAVAQADSALVTLMTLLLCIPISTASITYGVFQEMRGRETSLGRCLSVGMSSLLPVLSVAFLQILFVFGAVVLAIVPIALVIGMMLSGGTRSSAACSIMLLPLLLLCYVPALMLWLRFFVAVPAAVEERPGALDSLRRSAFLTTGNRGRIFGVMLVLIAVTVAVQLGVLLVPVAGRVLGPLLDLVTTGLFATTCAVIYYRLRSFHESIDVDQIASVFN
jgi:hypothetical protein